VYKEQIKDYKEVTAKNTEAFLAVAKSSDANTQVTKENTKTLSDLRMWLIENLAKT
jgi:hypothetical protein